MKEWADKYKGKFDDGWDKYRERVCARQKELGWIPQSTKLTPRPENLASWESIPDDEKPFQRRLMEIFAGFTEHADYNVGRIVDEIERQGKLHNTLIFYILGDNGKGDADNWPWERNHRHRMAASPEGRGRSRRAACVCQRSLTGQTRSSGRW